MAAIEHVAEHLHETESNDVEMRSPMNEDTRDMKTLSYDMKNASSSSPTSSLNKFAQSPVEAENKEFQAKFSAIGTSSRPHHSGKKKVVRISLYQVSAKAYFSKTNFYFFRTSIDP